MLKLFDIFYTFGNNLKFEVFCYRYNRIGDHLIIFIIHHIANTCLPISMRVIMTDPNLLSFRPWGTGSEKLRRASEHSSALFVSVPKNSERSAARRSIRDESPRFDSTLLGDLRGYNSLLVFVGEQL